MAEPQFNVHDINIADTSVFANNGAQVPMRRVTFFVGDHGPFQLTYAKAAATADTIKSDIQAEVDSLKSIHSLQS